MSSSSFSAASTFLKQRVAYFSPFLLAFLPLGIRAFPIVKLTISLVAVGGSVIYGVLSSIGSSVGIGIRAGTGTSVGASIGLKKGVGVIGLAGVSLSMTALIGAPGPSLFLAAFEPFLGLRTASETSTPFASYVACIFHNVDVATKKLSRHRLPLACCHLQP